MNRKKRIESILSKNFINWTFTVIDNSLQHIGHNNFTGNEESHFCVTLKKPLNSMEKRIEIHRKLNNLLEKEFHNGLHALEIKVSI